jgi:glycosyltransferase involved in cell wall biosynthesis
MDLFAYALLSSYAVGCLLLFVVWNFRLKITDLKGDAGVTSVSIIIPVRNESKNIENLMQCIDNQDYEKNNFELIIVNDSSEDNTVSTIEDFKRTSTLNIIIIDLKERSNNSSPKKRAITEALRIAKGELIITTDGDCTMNSKWLSSVVRFYVKTNAYFISAPVSFITENRGNWLGKFWNYFQVIESRILE